MRLFEAIIDANHRAAGGDRQAGLRPAEFAEALPVVALTCIDPRLNPLIPEVLGIPEEDFIWLRNAGNIITHPLSSTMRSLALACAIKGGREIAILGHTDCRVRQTTVMELTQRFQALGINRSRLPDNLNEYFGLFASERQNVLTAVEIVRHSPLIGSRIPVHGLLVDILSGKLEWLLNGYEALDRPILPEAVATLPATADLTAADPGYQLGDKTLTESRIGEGLVTAAKWLAEHQVVETPTSIHPAVAEKWLAELHVVDPSKAVKPGAPPAASALPPVAPPKIPLPPLVRPTFKLLKRKK